MEACQVSPEGVNTKLETSSAFEFVDAKIGTTILIKEVSSEVLMEGSRAPLESRAFQLKQFSSKDDPYNPSSKTEMNESSSERPLKFTDIVVLKAGDGSLEKFYVHKYKLIQESPVFAKMFSETMSEKTTGEVVLKDCTALVLEAFIGFLYESVSESRSDVSIDVLLDVLVFAHQYDITTIVHHVKKKMISVRNEDLNLELALKIFTAGYLYEMHELKSRAVQWIKCNKIQVKTAEGKKRVQELIDADKDLGSSIFAEVL